MQEEVLERAKKAKERAARETMEEQGLVASRATTINREPAAGVVVTSVTPTSTVETNTIVGGVVESSSSSDEDSD